MSIIAFSGSLMVACVLNTIAAIKIWRWFTLPFIILNFIDLCILFTCHVFLMMIFKKQLNLGVLIAVCSVGGFFILYLAYMWSCSIALFQIIGVVNSKEYQKILSMGSPAPEKSQKNFTVSSIVSSKQLEAEGLLHARIFSKEFSNMYRRPKGALLLY